MDRNIGEGRRTPAIAQRLRLRTNLQPSSTPNDRLDGLSPSGIVERIDELLEVAHRSGDLGNVSDILSEAIYILLSLQTREAVYQRVYRALRARFPRWTDVLTSQLPELEDVLRPAGFQRQRANKLRRLLEEVDADNCLRGVGRARGDDLTLDYLRDMTPAAAESFLASLHGIGIKSARCIAVYSLGHESFPVDTHVARIFDRLELLPRGRWKPQHDDYQTLVPAKLRRRLHINLVHHGRVTCKSANPRCDSCVLVSFCTLGRSRLRKLDNVGALDLFAGAGGMGTGFENAGFPLGLAIEQERNAAQTYRANHPGVPVLEASVEQVTDTLLKNFVPTLGRPAVVIAGPPCQGYSIAGPREPSAARNFLYKEVIRIAAASQAASVVIENVPGALRVGSIDFADSIETELQAQGFLARRFILEGPDYGVPQRRRRIFFVAIERARDVTPTEPPPTAARAGIGDSRLPTTLSLEATLRKLPERESGVQDDAMVLREGLIVYNAATMAHAPRVVAKIAEISPGSGPLSYRRLPMDVAQTIIAGHRALPVHPWLHRTISVREAAVIQGFPVDYVFCGPRSTQPLQVANAVPPPIAQGVANHLRQQLAACKGEQAPVKLPPNATSLAT